MNPFNSGETISMQDLSREDINLMNGGCDKVSILAHSETSLEGLQRSTDQEPTSVQPKLADNGDTYPWHTINTDIGSNLL